MENILSETSKVSLNWNVRNDLKGKTLSEIKDSQPCLPYSIGAVNIDGSLNIGVMLRTAVIFGAESFFIIGKKKYDKRSTVGAQNYIDVHKIKDELIFSSLDEYCNWPVFIETGGKEFNENAIKRIEYHSDFNLNPNYRVNPCFVFGSESEGIPKGMIPNNYEYVYSLPQLGVLRSLNVSSCASIVMYKYLETIGHINK